MDTSRHLFTPGPLPHASVVASWLQEAFGMGTAPSSSLIPTSDTVSSITNIITSAASTIANIASSNSGDVLSQGSDQVLQSSSSFSDSDRIFELSAATLYSLAYVQVRTACRSVYFFKYNTGSIFLLHLLVYIVLHCFILQTVLTHFLHPHSSIPPSPSLFLVLYV